MNAARAIRAAVAFAAAWLATSSVAAQPEELFPWGYAAAFGRGLYRLSDGTEAQIYRAQFKPPLHKPNAAGEGLAVRLVLPVTIGLQNLRGADLPLDREHDDLEAYEFMPGVELEMNPGKRFTLRANAQGGWGKQLEGERPSARLTSFGVRGRLKFVDAPGRPAFVAGVLWAGVDPNDGERSALLRVTAGLELDVATPRWQVRGQPMRLMPHVLEDRYYPPHGALALGDAPTAELPDPLSHEWQLGLAAGRDVPFKIWFFKFNALGVAYRFSDFSQGIRFYLNSVF